MKIESINMKYTSTILLSLFLFGACSARTMDFESAQGKNYRSNSQEMDESRRRDSDSQVMRDYHQQENQNQRSEKTSQNLENIKDVIAEKVGDLYNKITGQDDSPIVYFENLPSFVDPVKVGSVVDKFTLATVNYQHVEFYGLGSAYHGSVQVNLHSHKAVLKVNLRDASIKGQYAASNLINKSNGGFHIQFSGDVYYQHTVSYQYNNGQVHFGASSGELHYGKADSQYENIGFFAQIFQNSLGRVLLETVNNKIHDEVYPKVQQLLEHHVSELYQHAVQVKSSERARGGIQIAVDEVQKAVARQNVKSIELRSGDKEFVYHQLRAKISSVKLHGMEKFYLSGNDLSYNNNQFQAKVQLAVEKPTATAIISVHNDKEENSPFQKYNVKFNMQQIYAELGVAKRSQRGLELDDIQTYVNEVQPMDAERYQGEMQSLVKHQLSTHVKQYIEDGLKQFIRDQVTAIISENIVPSFTNQRENEQSRKY